MTMGMSSWCCMKDKVFGGDKVKEEAKELEELPM